MDSMNVRYAEWESQMDLRCYTLNGRAIALSSNTQNRFQTLLEAPEDHQKLSVFFCVFGILLDGQKPSKIYAKTLQNSSLERHFACHFRALGVSQHNPRFFTLFVPFFSTSGSSWSRLGRQVGPKLAPEGHPMNLKNL